MTKYNRGSAAIITAVIVALILVAVGAFYVGVKYAYRDSYIGLNAQPSGINNVSDTTNTNSATGANTNNQEVAKPVITDKTIADYYNDPSRQDVSMAFNIVKPGFITAKSTQYSTMQELTVLARGDINLDGYEDIILHIFSCGASCSNGLIPVLNDKNGGIVDIKAGFPEYGFKSSYSDASISNGVVTVIGSTYDSDGTSRRFVKLYKLSGGVYVEVK